MNNIYARAGKIVLRNFLLFIAAITLLCILLALLPDSTAGSFGERIREYLVITVTFDFGMSSFYGWPVWDVIFDRAQTTLTLIGYAIAFVVFISLPIALFDGLNKKSKLSRYIVYPIYLLSSVPVLIWATIMMIIAFIGFQTVPVYSNLEGAGFWQSLFIIFPPVLSLAIGDGMLYDTYRNIRDEIRKLMTQPWVKGLKARGRTVNGHIARGLVEPLTISLTSKLTYLISGTIIVEYIFNWQGLGLLIWETTTAHGAKDYPVIIAAVLFLIFLVIVASVIRDVVHTIFNPHISETI